MSSYLLYYNQSVTLVKTIMFLPQLVMLFDKANHNIATALDLSQDFPPYQIVSDFCISPFPSTASSIPNYLDKHLSLIGKMSKGCQSDFFHGNELLVIPKASGTLNHSKSNNCEEQVKFYQI